MKDLKSFALTPETLGLEISKFLLGELGYQSLREFSQSQKALVIFLDGPLGVGKTELVKSLLMHWGLEKSKVKSPTFLKLLEYELKDFGKILHMDLYRMEHSSELTSLGLEEYLFSHRLWFIEWPQLFSEYFKENEVFRRQIENNFKFFHLVFTGLGKFTIVDNKT